MGSIIAYFITKPINKALRVVGETSAKYAGGDFQDTVKVNSSDELGQLAGDLNKMRDSFRDESNLFKRLVF